jgi:oxygen-independent coproporphyrinogen-3 oxidase
MNYSLYVHIPFCKQRCHYCDFITYAGKESLIPGYIQALIQELRIVYTHLPKISLHSIYFGGGTSSLISLSHYQKLLKVIRAQFILADDCEISLEANPGTVSLAYLQGLRTLGFNRISFGVQSTNAMDLIRLDRIHNNEDSLQAVEFARQAGFDNINMDMIFNYPWQDLSSWQHSLCRAVDLAPQHFSLYSLTIEPGTPFFDWYQRGLIAPQDGDLAADMYESAIKLLAQAGYQHYEISNWAKKDHSHDYRCRHNLQYWLNEPYIGVGAGAHGYLGNIRTENTHEIEKYMYSLNENNVKAWKFPHTPATIKADAVDLATQMRDFMWLGLRLLENGVSMARFLSTFGCSAQDVFKTEIEELLGLGLVEWGDANQENLKLTHKGNLLANQVFMRFI